MNFGVGLTDVGLKFTKKAGFKTLRNCILTSYGLIARNGTDILTSYLDSIKGVTKIFPFGTTEKITAILILSFINDNIAATVFNLETGEIAGNKEVLMTGSFHFKTPEHVEVKYFSNVHAWVITGSYVLCKLAYNPASNTPVSISAISVQLIAGIGATNIVSTYFSYPKSLISFQGKMGLLCGNTMQQSVDAPQYYPSNLIVLYNKDDRSSTDLGGNVYLALSLLEGDDWTDIGSSEDSIYVTGAKGIEQISSSNGEAFTSTTLVKAKIISAFSGGGCNIEFSAGRYVFYAGNNSIRVKQNTPQFQGSGLILAGDSPALPQLLNKTFKVKRLLNVFDYILALDETRLYAIKISYEDSRPYFSVYEYAQIDGYVILDVILIGLEIYIMLRSQNDQLVLTKINRDSMIDLNTKVAENTIGKTITIPEPFRVVGTRVVLSTPDSEKSFLVDKSMVLSGIIDLGTNIDRSNVKIGLPIKIVIEPQGELKTALRAKTAYFSFIGDFNINEPPFWESYVTAYNQKPEKIIPKASIIDENFSMHVPIPCSSQDEKFTRYALNFIVKQKISIDHIE